MALEVYESCQGVWNVSLSLPAVALRINGSESQCVHSDTRGIRFHILNVLRFHFVKGFGI